MQFIATETQVRQIALNAILASKVVGMGKYQAAHFAGVPLGIGDIDLDDEGVYIDYFRGKMVKLGIVKEGENLWKISNSVDIEYQSWVQTYPTTEDLVNSVLGSTEQIDESTLKKLDQANILDLEVSGLPIRISFWQRTADRKKLLAQITAELGHLCYRVNKEPKTLSVALHYSDEENPIFFNISGLPEELFSKGYSDRPSFSPENELDTWVRNILWEVISSQKEENNG